MTLYKVHISVYKMEVILPFRGAAVRHLPAQQEPTLVIKIEKSLNPESDIRTLALVS